jgi:osmoprotectant transport system permease protein
MIEAWEFFSQHPDLYLEWTLRHLWIVFVSCSIAMIIGVVVGIYISGKGRARLAEILLYLADIMMTIPSLALFGLLMLILSAMGLTVYGFLPAVIALIVYGQMPILRNTYIAIQQIAPALIEAGRGMGMTDRQILFRIELPIAVPLIMAGLRNAIIILIGIATIAAFIGAGGLGVPIFRGIRNLRSDYIISGAVCVSLLALIIDGLMHFAERRLTPKGLKKA